MDDDSKEVEELKFKLRSNLAIVYLKKSNFVMCKDMCDEIILEYPDNQKAYYRKGCALISMKEYSDAIQS